MRPARWVVLVAGVCAATGGARAASDTDSYDRVEASISAPDRAPADTDFDLRVDGAIIDGISTDVYAYGLYENASWSYDTAHRVVITAGTPIDESSFELGASHGASYTLNQPTGFYTYTYFFGYRSSAHSWHDVAVEVPVLVGADCLVAALGAVELLKGVKDGSGGASFEWQADTFASEYHLNSVNDKTRLNPTDAHRPQLGSANSECSASTTSCTDVDALAVTDSLLYYQAFSACGPDGSLEGPMQ